MRHIYHGSSRNKPCTHVILVSWILGFLDCKAVPQQVHQYLLGCRKFVLDDEFGENRRCAKADG